MNHLDVATNYLKVPYHNTSDIVIPFPSGQPNFEIFEWIRMLFQLLLAVVISLGVITPLISGPSVGENPLEFGIFSELKTKVYSLNAFDSKCKMLNLQVS